jgi:hypothetical protein
VRGVQGITGVTVTIVGTSITTGVDGSGRFTLMNVPAGNVQLQFSGAVNGTLTVGTVGSTDTVDLTITVSGGTIAIDTEVQNGSSQAQLEGKIEALPPTTAAMSFSAAGRTVVTNSSTQFVDDQGHTRSFADLKVGMRVHVKGSLSGTTLTATRVELQLPDDMPPTTPAPTPTPTPTPTPPPPTPEPPEGQSVTITGTLTSISGTSPNLTLMVGTTTVHTTSQTEVESQNGDDSVKDDGSGNSLSALAVGQSLRVEGKRNTDMSVNAESIDILSGAIGTVQMSGSISGLAGTCPALTFVINGTTIKTSTTTSFKGGMCSALKNGTKVSVKGTRTTPTGPIMATTVSTGEGDN